MLFPAITFYLCFMINVLFLIFMLLFYINFKSAFLDFFLSFAGVNIVCKAFEVASDPKIRVMANFLAWYLYLESDYGVIDKLARARTDKDIVDALYAALRVKDRLKKRAKEERKVSEERFEEKVIPSQAVIDSVLKYASECPQIVGGVLAVLSLSMRPYVKEGEE